jgi:hypothetical protein
MEAAAVRAPLLCMGLHLWLSPCRCLTPIRRISQKASLLLLQCQREPHGIPRLFWTDFPRSFAWGGREGHCEHVGALTCLIYDASTRTMVVDSIRRGPYKQPTQVPQFLSMPGLGDADGTFV